MVWLLWMNLYFQNTYQFCAFRHSGRKEDNKEQGNRRGISDFTKSTVRFPWNYGVISPHEFVCSCILSAIKSNVSLFSHVQSRLTARRALFTLQGSIMLLSSVSLFEFEMGLYFWISASSSHVAPTLRRLTTKKNLPLSGAQLWAAWNPENSTLLCCSLFLLWNYRLTVH